MDSRPGRASRKPPDSSGRQKRLFCRLTSGYRRENAGPVNDRSAPARLLRCTRVVQHGPCVFSGSCPNLVLVVMMRPRSPPVNCQFIFAEPSARLLSRRSLASLAGLHRGHGAASNADFTTVAWVRLLSDTQGMARSAQEFDYAAGFDLNAHALRALESGARMPFADDR